MFTILIVDDEKVERQGVKLLLNKYKFDLNVAEAKNGEEALEYIKNNHVDILFSDIKMPFMDGLDLSYEAKKINSKIKIIIFSAYGEFEYARKAISNNTFRYILKPIDVNEFQIVIKEVVEVCKTERDEKEKSKKLLENYNKILVYEKENILLEIINGNNIDDFFISRMEQLKLSFVGNNITMLLIDLQNKFFDEKNDEFVKTLINIIKTDFEYINLNEFQSIIFLNTYKEVPDREFLINLGESIQKELLEKHLIKSYLVFGKEVEAVEELKIEYRNMEEKLDLKFFHVDGALFFASDPVNYDSTSEEIINNILMDIFNAIDSGSINYSILNIRRLFQFFKSNGSLSTVYVKYVCVDIIKKIIEKATNKDYDFMSYVEKVFAKGIITELENDILNLISMSINEDLNKTEEVTKTAIKRVFDIIEHEYMNDITLEYIADKVYLTPSYLSFLFKKETEQSLFKYITLYRLKKAQALLDNSNMKVSDIGEKVGYPNLSYFCMIFKNNYGMTPAKYRERVENN